MLKSQVKSKRQNELSSFCSEKKLNKKMDGWILNTSSFYPDMDIVKSKLDQITDFVRLAINLKEICSRAGWTPGPLPVMHGKKITAIIDEDYRLKFLRMDTENKFNKPYFKTPSLVFAYKDFYIEEIPDEKIDDFLMILEFWLRYAIE